MPWRSVIIELRIWSTSQLIARTLPAWGRYFFSQVVWVAPSFRFHYPSAYDSATSPLLHWDLAQAGEKGKPAEEGGAGWYRLEGNVGSRRGPLTSKTSPAPQSVSLYFT